MIELFINLAHLVSFAKGKPVLAKVNYQGQFDVRVLINPKKYDIVVQQGDSMVLVKKKPWFRKMWF